MALAAFNQRSSAASHCGYGDSWLLFPPCGVGSSEAPDVGLVVLSLFPALFYLSAPVRKGCAWHALGELYGLDYYGVGCVQYAAEAA